MKKVIVGMSGGVDSAVTALLLKREGYDVTGVMLRNWQSEDGGEGRCCETDDARRVAMKLGIRFVPVNCMRDFEEKVIEPFVKDYVNGLTPNPCIECNRYVKWDRLMRAADELGADCVATGHYAKVVLLENGRYTVKRADHADKDQTYMLYKLSQEQLARTLMPLGAYSKADVRRIAEEEGLPVAAKPDSQEICFVPDGDYADFIAARTDRPLPSEGNFVDETGRVLGKHKGIIHYTVGQRKGLGIAMGYPVFVKKIDTVKNEVVLGSDESLYSDTVICRDINWLGIEDLAEGSRMACRAKVRYRHEAEAAQLERISADEVKLVFEHPVRAAAPGQSSVFYDADGCVIGGGIIV